MYYSGKELFEENAQHLHLQDLSNVLAIQIRKDNIIVLNKRDIFRFIEKKKY